MEDYWKRFKAWFEENENEKLASLLPEVFPHQIEEVESRMQMKFPNSFSEWLQVHDNADATNGFIGGWDLMPIGQIVQEWSMMKQLALDGLFGENKTEATKQIKGFWWNPKWIPIVSSGLGNFFCIDNDPATKGRKGQIILFLHDDGKRFLVANSFEAWIARIVSDLESDVYDIEGGRFNHEAFMKSSIEGKNIF